MIGFLPLRDVGTQHILRVLRHTGGKISPAARILGVTRWSLARRLGKHSIRPPATESDGEIATMSGLFPLHDLETRHILRVLRHTGGKIRPAARILGVTRWSLARRLRKHSIQSRATEAAGPMGPAAHTRHEFQYSTEARRGE